MDPLCCWDCPPLGVLSLSLHRWVSPPLGDDCRPTPLLENSPLESQDSSLRWWVLPPLRDDYKPSSTNSAAGITLTRVPEFVGSIGGIIPIRKQQCKLTKILRSQSILPEIEINTLERHDLSVSKAYGKCKPGKIQT